MRELSLNGYIDEDVWYGDEITPDMLHEQLFAEDEGHQQPVRIIDVGSGVIDAAADRTVVLKDAEARVKMWFDRSRARLERHDNKAAALVAVADASEPAPDAVEDASEAPATEVIPEKPVTQPVEPGVPVAQLHRRLELIKSRH